MLVICFRGKLPPLGVITSFAIHKSQRLHGNSCHGPAQLITNPHQRRFWQWLISQVRFREIGLGFSGFIYENESQIWKPSSSLKTRFCFWASSRPRKGPREVSPPDQSLPRRPGAEAQSDLLNLSELREGGESSDIWALGSAKQRSALSNCFGAQSPINKNLNIKLFECLHHQDKWINHHSLFNVNVNTLEKIPLHILILSFNKQKVYLFKSPFKYKMIWQCLSVSSGPGFLDKPKSKLHLMLPWLEARVCWNQGLSLWVREVHLWLSLSTALSPQHHT